MKKIILFRQQQNQAAKMIINLKNEPSEVQSWFQRAEETTGMSKSAIVTGIVMEFLHQANEKKANEQDNNREAR